eukprot:TRINITY_DN1462_c0_g1_i1.p1 TRINITY_DN1462_c0_g1~~TRINITY_DN1462_c0_g1_i1.p1  ORF type:complete len:382 (+),score=83.26 TRINITY_DN1462_c0_g1_i1:52-1197(+)
MKTAVTALAAAIVTASADVVPLTKITLSDYPTARCLDGSPYVMYYRPAPAGSEHPTNWVFNLRGGGACLDPEACHHRAQGVLGSSKSYGPTWTNEYGSLSSNKTINPFWDFNHVFLPYCTGDVHTGTNDKANEWNLYFAGHINVEATLKYFLANGTLGNATKVLLSGESAGGIGVFNNANFVMDMLPHAEVMAMPVAGWYFPENTHSYPEWLSGEDIPYNYAFCQIATRFFSSYLDKYCTADFSGDKRRCLDATVNYDYIKTPLFVMENMYDSQQINDELLCPGQCVPGYKEAYGTWMRNTMQKYVMASPKANNGLFMPSCYDHTADLCVGHDVMVNKTTFRQAAGDWFFNRKTIRYIDDCDGSLPCNTMCSTGRCADPDP